MNDERVLELLEQYKNYLNNFPLDVSGMPDEVVEELKKFHV